MDKLTRLLGVGMWVWLVALGAASCSSDDGGSEVVTATTPVVGAGATASTSTSSTTSTSATTTTTGAPEPVAPPEPSTAAAAVAQEFAHLVLSRGDFFPLLATFTVDETGRQIPRDEADRAAVAAWAQEAGRTTRGGGTIVAGALEPDDAGDDALGPGCGYVGDFHVECHVVHRREGEPDVMIDVALLCDVESTYEYRVVDFEIRSALSASGATEP